MARKPKSDDPLFAELISIKKLLILQLLNDGLTQAQVAKALGIDRTYIGKMVPVKISKQSTKIL